MGKFTGFGPNTLQFFSDLAANNDRDWFNANRAIYDDEIKAPMLALLEDLNDRFAVAKLPLSGSAKTLFRTNRDVRFAKDKRPYQTHIGAVLTSTGEKMADGIVYIHVAPPDVTAWSEAPSGSFTAVGFHTPEPASLDKLRRAIANDPAAFQKMEKALAKSGLALGDGEALKRLPRGYEEMKESPVEAAIRKKSFVAEAPLPPAEITSPKLADRIFAIAASGRPLLDYGWDALS